MNPSEDPNDRLIDSLLSEQAKGKPDEVLLRAIASKMQAVPKATSERRNLDFFWPATAAAVVLLAAGGLLWNAFEKKEIGNDDSTLAVPSDLGPAKTGEGVPASDLELPRPVADQDSGGGNTDPGRLLDELRFVRDESTGWYVQFGLESGGKWAPRFTGRTADQSRLQNRLSAVEMLSVGDVFFREGTMAGRFKFIGFTEREVTSERTKLTQKVKFAQYEDLKPNKKGERYESRYGLPDAQLMSKAYHDWTAVMEFQGKEFKVEERTGFTLPGGGDYFLKHVTPDRIVVELTGTDGKVVVREIGKK